MSDANVWEPGCTDAEGGGDPVGGDGYVPTGGTVASDPIVGPLVFSNTTDGTEYTLSMPTGALNSLVFAATINGNPTGYIIDTSDGAAAYRFNFQEDGFLVLPSGKDYDLAPADAVVSKTWIEDAIVSGGSPNTYLKLAGTDLGVPYTGTINFEDAGSGINYDIGLVDFAGFTGMYLGKSTGGSAVGANTLIITDTDNLHAFIDDRLLSPGIKLYDKDVPGFAQIYEQRVTQALGVNTFVLEPTVVNSGFVLQTLSADGLDLHGLGASPNGNLEWTGTGFFKTATAVFGSALTPQVGFDVTINGSQYIDTLLSVTNGGNTASILTNILGCDSATVINAPTGSTGIGNRSYNDNRYLRANTAANITAIWQFDDSALFNSTITYGGAPSFTGTNIVMNGFGVISLDTCDMRLKDNVVELDYGLTEVLAADIIRYDWRHDFNADGTNKVGIGFNAQQLQDIVPEGAPYNAENDTYGIASTPLIATLWKAVQELTARVQELEAREV